MRPVVTVPVLSSTIASMRRVDSSTSGPLITPWGYQGTLSARPEGNTKASTAKGKDHGR